ncbi:carbohydrate sulfotransferase 11-like isoform X2 [Oculina patagonica]
MHRRNSLLFAFFTSAFIVTFYIVLCIVWKNSWIYSKQETTNIDHDDITRWNPGWNLTRERKTQNGSNFDTIQRVNLESMNLKRQAAFRDFCKKNNRIDEPVNTKSLNHILVDEKLKILFCFIPKISCTQWKSFMVKLRLTENEWTRFSKILNNSKTIAQIHEAKNFKFLHSYPTEEAKRVLKSYFKIVFVREPFERLLSAYLSKFVVERLTNSYFHATHGRKIIERYRPGGNPEDRNVTFDEFIHHVVDGNWDDHWAGYDNLCHPCGIHYDFIGKFENLEEEARQLLEISGISRKKNVSFPEVKPSSTSSKIPFYYSQISKERLYRIVQLYGGDSEMFQYDLPKYLQDRIEGTD